MRFISKVSSLEADYFVFDLEDSITSDEIGEALANLQGLGIKENYYIRPNFYHSDDENAQLIYKIIDLGFRNFLIPKFSSVAQLEIIRNFLDKDPNYIFQEFRFIIVVEHPAGVIDLNRAIESRLLNVTGAGLGSHDYCNIMGMQHTLSNIAFARQSVLNSAKAFGLEAIDIVSTDLKNDTGFIEEVRNGFSMGFDAKFLINPRQLELLKKVEFYSQDEVEEAMLVYDQIQKNTEKQVAVLKINGKVYERPHIKRVIQIVDWHNKTKT